MSFPRKRESRITLDPRFRGDDCECNMRYLISSVAVLVMLFLCAAHCSAQTALNAPPDDPVYQAVDIFIANRLIGDVIIGQRPFSRLEIARILRKVRESLEEMKKKENEKAMSGEAEWRKFGRESSRIYYLEKMLSWYEKEYSRELAGMKSGIEFDAFSELDISVLYNSSEPRTVPVHNGQGGIDGIVTSFDRYSQGKTYADGGNTFLWSKHDLYMSRYFAMTAQPLFEIKDQRGGDELALAHIYKLYATTGWKNIQLEVGRDNLLWGQGEYGGLFASSNPRGLDMLKISNPYPLRLPWIFKYLGHMKWTLFVSNLGPEQALKYPYFYGLKWTIRPFRYLEFGICETLITAGEGAPKLSFWDPVTEMFAFHKWGGNNITAADLSDHAFGLLDLRITIPPLRHSILYYDAYFEDSFVRAFRLFDNILEQMSFVVGWYSPRVSRNGNVGLRLAYHHISPGTYRHYRWVSGYTLNRRMIGDPLGPAADGVYATLYLRPSPTFLSRLDLAYEDYDSSTYRSEENAQGGLDRILKDVAGPHEKRYRAVAGMEWRGKKRYGLKFSLGYERINNWNFEVGKSVNNVLAQTVLTLYFDEFDVGTN